eukprot:gnl/TRDRNA2_/TRDRNA2_182247_c0_seq1.p1 gnl/TRDRNA2_/TRDRNA2_182247_c0~~gnl/TRDRNA2_/TRDRNA2_182247_c0_seq1.p1  ORF type:complete len:218 (-),score=64.74 gnl/TRDRNA2_/TRDRNA2_182247_c0_seq1:97-750(-)
MAKTSPQEDLFVALSFGSLAPVKKALDAGAKVDVEDEGSGWFPIHCAASSGNLEIVDLIISKKADVNVQSREKKTTAMHIAAKEGNLPILERLVKASGDIDATDRKGKRPIHLACMETKEPIARFLIDKGCDPLTPDGLRCTPHDYALVAAEHGSLANLEIKRMLEKKECDKTGGGVQWVPPGAFQFEGLAVAVGEGVNKPGKAVWDKAAKKVVMKA